MAAKRPKPAQPKRPGSRQASEIVSLIQQLSSGLGAPDGVILGQGLSRLLTDAYAARGRSVPVWVKQLAAFYGDGYKS